MDVQCAVKATAYELVRLVYAMMIKGEPYVEQGMKVLEHQRREHKLARLKCDAKALGLRLEKQVVVAAT